MKEIIKKIIVILLVTLLLYYAFYLIIFIIILRNDPYDDELAEKFQVKENRINFYNSNENSFNEIIDFLIDNNFIEEINDSERNHEYEKRIKNGYYVTYSKEINQKISELDNIAYIMKDLRIKSIVKLTENSCVYYSIYLVNNLDNEISYTFSNNSTCLGEDYYTETERYNRTFFAEKASINANWFSFFSNIPTI